jgi:hypothetical protein
MFTVVDQFTDEEIKEGSEQEVKAFVNKYNQYDGIEHYIYTAKKDRQKAIA